MKALLGLNEGSKVGRRRNSPVIDKREMGFVSNRE